MFSTILLDHVVRTFGAVRATRVLDVGCGRGPYRDLMEPELYVGIDRTPAAEGDGLLVEADATALPLSSATFDGLVCTEVIEHVPDEKAFAEELARVATPGATLVLSAPFVHGLHELPYDFRRLTSIGLVRVLSDAGWEVCSVAAIGGPLVVSVDSAVRWGTSRLQGVARRVSSAPARRAIEALPARLQVVLAAVALRGSAGRGQPIDPEVPVPPITLGYVVVARRRS